MAYIIKTKNTNEDKIKTISHSKLYTYTKCPYLYKAKYIEDLFPTEKKSYLELGTLVHRTFEIYHQSGFSILESFNQAKIEFLSNLRLDIDRVDSLIEIHEKLSYLASEKCTDKQDWIRNKDGELYKKPSMSNAWKDKADSLGLTEGLAELRSWLIANNPDYSELDIPSIIVEAKQLVSNYKLPDWINCIDPDYIEFPISEQMDTVIINPVLIDEYTYFTGFIDFVAYTNKGQVIIGDHKTDNSPAPSVAKVEAKPQLNRYAWAWRELTGRLPDFIAIHHVRSGSWVAAPVNPAYVERAYQDMLALSKLIDSNNFYTRNPDEYDSPCWKCELLKHCWPKFVIEKREQFIDD